MVEDHGAAMSTRDKKDARKVAAEFQFEGVGVGRGRRDGHHRERDREPPPGPPPPRILAGPSNSRRAAFGGSLTDGTNHTPVAHASPSHASPSGTNPAPVAHPSPSYLSPSGTSTPLAADVDPAVAEYVLIFYNLSEYLKVDNSQATFRSQCSPSIVCSEPSECGSCVQGICSGIQSFRNKFP
jgi:hypothetical protein